MRRIEPARTGRVQRQRDQDRRSGGARAAAASRLKMTFEAAIRLMGRTLRPSPEPLRVAAPVQMDPRSGPAGIGQTAPRRIPIACKAGRSGWRPSRSFRRP
jgi:hypothetical protein